MCSADKIHHQIRKCGILDRAEKRLEEIENIGLSVGCVPSVSERFRSKEQGTRGKTRATENPIPRRSSSSLCFLWNYTETLATHTSLKPLSRGPFYLHLISPPKFCIPIVFIKHCLWFFGGDGRGKLRCIRGWYCCVWLGSCYELTYDWQMEVWNIM